MFLIVGLGNPKRKFKKTRHNIGFRVLDCIQKENGFPKFKFEKKFNADVSVTNNIILLKPQTFMNNSGRAIKAFRDYYKINIEDIFIIHDDLSLELGKVKLSYDKESAGHNGVRSIITDLQTKKFKRIRIGIKPIEKIESIKDFVLKKFSKKEELILQKTRETIKEMLPF